VLRSRCRRPGIFLYDWWPIRAEAHLYDRLSTMLVRVVDATPAIAEAGRA